MGREASCLNSLPEAAGLAAGWLHRNSFEEPVLKTTVVELRLQLLYILLYAQLSGFEAGGVRYIVKTPCFFYGMEV
jgi:hypothetical protein